MDKPATPPPLPIFVGPPLAENRARPLSYWLKKFFACNPFYLVSAAMLLYGVYLVSFDANFPGRETSQLAFNFSSLQVYEILLAVTAIFLARRRIWYDSTLLVGLENLLVLVPFILISQAALLSRRVELTICAAAAAAVLLRFWGLKHFFRELNLPRRALVCGLGLLLVNVALPLVYRHLHESKVGTKPTEGAAYELNRYCWLLLVPAMFALIHFLTRSRTPGNLLPQHRRLPLGLFTLWFAGSVTHIYCLSYVYNFDWEFVFIVPLLWAAAWTAFLRHGDFVARPATWLPRVLLAPPLLMALLALTQSSHRVFLTLTILNMAGYLALFVKDRRNLTALNLMLLSGATLAGGLARSIGPEPYAPDSINSGKWLVLAAVMYVLFWIVRSRNPKAAVGGAALVVVSTLIFIPSGLGLELAVQGGLVFLLLHSLRWVDAEHPGAGAARNLACVMWFTHALGIAHWHGSWATEIILGSGGLLLGAAILVRLITGTWRPAMVPLTALFVLLITPGELAVDRLQTTRVGLLVVAGSFVLFGLGTLAALTKPRWNTAHAAAAGEAHSTD